MYGYGYHECILHDENCLIDYYLICPLDGWALYRAKLLSGTCIPVRHRHNPQFSTGYSKFPHAVQVTSQATKCVVLDNVS